MDATNIRIPFDVETVFGAKRIPVKVSIKGAEHRSTIVKMGGKYLLGVPKEFRYAAKINVGDSITVALEKDEEKRAIEEAKREETRLKRIEKTVEYLIGKRK